MPKNNLKPKNLSKKPLSKKSSVWHFLKFKIQNSKFKISVQNSKIWNFGHWILGFDWKLKIGNWKFVSLAIFALIVSGTLVYFSLLPQSARSKTFTFFQTAWSSVVATAVHNPDGSDQTAITTYASKDAQVSVSSGTDATLAATADRSEEH